MESRAPILPVTQETPLLPALQAWQRYLENEGYSPHTIRAFMSDLRLLARYLGPNTPVGRVALRDLQNFVEWLEHGRGVPCSPKSLTRRITSVKAFFRWLHKYGVLQENPALRLVQRSATTAMPKVLTPEQTRGVLQAALAAYHAGDPRPFVLFTLLYATGLKKGEVLNLQQPHLVLESPQGPYLFVRYPNPAQRYKERRVFLPAAWVPAFRAYQARYAITERLFPWTGRALEYVLEHLGQRAGLPFRLSFAICRWTASLRDWRAGMAPEALREKLGLSPVQWRDVAHKLAQLDRMIPASPSYPEVPNPAEAPGDL